MGKAGSRGWGIARSKAAGGVVKAPSAKPGFTRQAINTPKVHHTSTAAINMSKTQRAPWQKLG